MEEKNIYEMNLHDVINISGWISVTRIPGGWIYSFDGRDGYGVSSTFVPFHGEFDGKIKRGKENKN